jgi:hypothetical protein
MLSCARYERVRNTAYPNLREFAVYIRPNNEILIPYSVRFRAGERISWCLAVPTVNAVISRRFAKRQQMRWTQRVRTCCPGPGLVRSMARVGRSSRNGVRGW